MIIHSDDTSQIILETLKTQLSIKWINIFLEWWKIRWGMIFVYILEIFIVNLAALDPTLTHKQQSCFTDGRRPLLSKLT